MPVLLADMPTLQLDLSCSINAGLQCMSAMIEVVKSLAMITKLCRADFSARKGVPHAAMCGAVLQVPAVGRPVLPTLVLRILPDCTHLQTDRQTDRRA